MLIIMMISSSSSSSSNSSSSSSSGSSIVRLGRRDVLRPPHAAEHAVLAAALALACS